MDARTGEIFQGSELMREFQRQLRHHQRDGAPIYLKPMKFAPTETQLNRRPFPRVGRNDTCPCGSGNKFKKCCLNKTTDSKELRDLQREALGEGPPPGTLANDIERHVEP